VSFVYPALARLSLVAVLACLVVAAPASAAFHIVGVDAGAYQQDGSSATQAAGHPYVATTHFELGSAGFFAPDGSVKDVTVDLPPGFVANPTATPTVCTPEQLTIRDQIHDCPVSSQVGVAHIYFASGVDTSFQATGPGDFPIFNVVPRRGAPATLSFVAAGVVANIVPRLRTGGDYGLSADAKNIGQFIPLVGADVDLWGVPADPSHDALRYCRGANLADGPIAYGCSSDAEPVPFLTNPTNCAAGALPTTLSFASWQEPGIFISRTLTTDRNGNPTAVDGCGEVPFAPGFSAAPTTRTADAPSGLDVDLTMPTDGLTDLNGLAQGHLKRATVTLPEGMTISPSSADGLAGCSDAQLGLTNADASTCPEAAKIGTVSIETPLLKDPLLGGIYVRTQNSSDPASGEMFRLAIVVDDEATGLRVKLAGGAAVDPDTGRITTTFDGNPQIPFSKLSLHLKAGPRAPLATPVDCGTKTVQADLTSWSGKTVTRTDSFTIDCPGVQPLVPTFKAGTTDPSAGHHTTFAVRIDRPDGQQIVNGLTMKLPPGLTATLKGVPQCSDLAAATGTCDESARVGTATVGAGPGSNPFFLRGGAYLTGPYKGAPFGLSVAVRAVAGPFDLGSVVVRQQLIVDPIDAHVTVVSDPLPTILKGVPIRLRSLNVDVDRKGFILNPTSCSPKTINAAIGAPDGSVFNASSPFGVTNCAALPLKPKVKLALTGKRETNVGRHPGLRVRLAQPAGQANLRTATALLPLTLALDPANANALCEYDDGVKGDCPKGSIIGSATAISPLLNRPLTAPVYFVKGIRFGKGGRRIRTLPTLFIPLRGEVSIDLRATSEVKGQKLVTTFSRVPDAAISRFDLRLKGGKGGILVVTNHSICKGRQVMELEFDGQNGKASNQSVGMRTPCAKRTSRKARHHR
jgi:hypothetical protein